jgi:hypothetical protein
MPVSAPNRRQTAAAVSALLVLAFVVPAVTAAIVNGRRVRAAWEAAGRLAREIEGCLPADRAGEGGRIAVLAGPGLPPRARDAAWTAGRLEALPATCAGRPLSDLRPDPWENRYVVDVPAVRSPGARGWVLSAGPNGIIETPFPVASGPEGDDVGVRVR